MKMHIRLAVLCLLGATLGGCALANVASSPAPQLFTLQALPPAQTVVPSAASKVGILVSDFTASAALDSARIAFQPNPNELKFYAGARWVDLAPLMVRRLAIQSLENSQQFASVAARGTEVGGDYVLKGDIRQFAAEADGEQTNVRVDLFMSLVDRDDRSLLAAKDFTAVEPISGHGIEVVISAYDKALSTVLRDITVWTANEVAKVPADTRKSGR
jgi:cholesterol transport system auxiliary component